MYKSGGINFLLPLGNFGNQLKFKSCHHIKLCTFKIISTKYVSGGATCLFSKNVLSNMKSVAYRRHFVDWQPKKGNLGVKFKTVLPTW
jgi:hypothetical protein